MREEMTNPTEAPEFVSQSEMKRHWWICYQWQDVTTVGDAEPKYAKGILRPINEAVEAAANFDLMWNARRAIEVGR